MCPACMAAAVWAAVGTTSAGGVTAFIVKKFRDKRAQGTAPSGEARTEPGKASPDRRL